MKTPTIIAHRTCPYDAPENSLEGMRKAAELGADGVEIDLRMTLDQRVYLMHDRTMRRTTGWRLPMEWTPSSIVRRRRLANGEPVPSLSDALDALAPGQMLAVDVKTRWAVIPLVREVRRRGLEDRVLIWCQSLWACRYAARRLPGAEVAYLKDVAGQEAGRRFLDDAVAAGAHAVSTHWRMVDASHVSDAHTRGLRIFSWHRQEKLTPEQLGAGLDILITDFPREARAAYAALE